MPKILIVEDDKDLCNLVSEYFAVAGYTVDKAFAGADGRNFLKTYQYDVIILDWNLPEISGIALCKEYRGQGGGAPIVFLTGKTDIADKETGLDAGSDDYITKPFFNSRTGGACAGSASAVAGLSPQCAESEGH